MQSEINKILKLNNFFNLISINKNIAKYSLKEPSRILLNNIYVQWLTSIWQKTDKHFPIYMKKFDDNKSKKLPFGYINPVQKYKENTIIEHDCTSFLPKETNKLELNILMPKSEIMQYFLQWQRYRKFWWSTITTSPGLFSLSDIRYDDKTEVDVLAHLPWGKQPVENIIVHHSEELSKRKTPISIMESSITLEGALYTLLLDGLLNQTPEEYLRLNKTLAPYKLAFALDVKGDDNKEKLCELANLLNYKINSNGVSTLCNDYSLPLHEQLLSYRKFGIAYVAVIDDNVLTDGIFNLMNSSTMLKEQIHIADFESYTKQLCR